MRCYKPTWCAQICWCEQLFSEGICNDGSIHRRAKTTWLISAANQNPNAAFVGANCCVFRARPSGDVATQGLGLSLPVTNVTLGSELSAPVTEVTLGLGLTLGRHALALNLADKRS